MAQIHLHLQSLELVGEASAGLGAHLLVCPLLQAVEFLVDVHGCGEGSAKRRAGRGEGDNEGSAGGWVLFIDRARMQAGA
jgi:hypothetical protein